MPGPFGDNMVSQKDYEAMLEASISHLVDDDDDFGPPPAGYTPPPASSIPIPGMDSGQFDFVLYFCI